MRRLAAILFAGFVTLGVAVAQPLPPAVPDRFEGTSPDPVPFAGELTVVFEATSGPAEIYVTAYDLADPTDTRTISVSVGSDAIGSTTFQVPPGWGGVVLVHPESLDHTVPTDSDGTPTPDPRPERETDQVIAAMRAVAWRDRVAILVG